jgi:hypothetical protein
MIYEVIFNPEEDIGYHKVVRGIMGNYGEFKKIQDGFFLFEFFKENRDREITLLGMGNCISGVTVNKLDEIQ